MTRREIGQRIHSRRLALGLTLQDVADTVHVARSTIQRYEAGTIQQLKMPIIQSIAQALRVNPSWLVGQSDDMEAGLPSNVFPMPEMRSVPLIGTIACGTPILAEENIEEYIDIPRKIRADFALECKGDSMIGAGIADGDIVYIRQQPEVPQGCIAAVLIGDEATLKRIYIRDGVVILQPENPAYPPLVYAGEQLDSVRILGRAIAFTHSLL